MVSRCISLYGEWVIVYTYIGFRGEVLPIDRCPLRVTSVGGVRGYLSSLYTGVPCLCSLTLTYPYGVRLLTNGGRFLFGRCEGGMLLSLYAGD